MNQRQDFPGGLAGENQPALQEIQVQSLGWEDPLEEEMATHYSILAWRIPWTEEPGELQSMGFAKSQTQLSTHTYKKLVFHSLAYETQNKPYRNLSNYFIYSTLYVHCYLQLWDLLIFNIKVQTIASFGI